MASASAALLMVPLGALLLLWMIFFNWRDWLISQLVSLLLVLVTFLSLLCFFLLCLWYRLGRKLEAELHASKQERRVVLQFVREVRTKVGLLPRVRRTLADKQQH